MINVTKRQLYFIIAVILVFMVTYIAYLLYSNRTILLNATPIRLPQQSGISFSKSGSVIFSNGRYFVEFNPNSNTTKPLGNELSLPLPSVAEVSMSSDNRYILFKSIDQNTDDALGKMMANSEINTFGETDWWWVYDTKTKEYKPIDARDKKNWIAMGGDELMTDNPPRNIVARMSPSNDSVYVLTNYSDETKKIIEVDLASGETKKIVEVDKSVEKFYIYQDVFIALQSDNIVTIDHTGKTLRTIKGPFTNIRNTGSGETSKVLAYGSDRTTSDTSFLVVDASTGKINNLNSGNPESSQTLSPQGNIVAYTGKNGLMYAEDGFVQKKYSVKIKDDMADVKHLDFVAIASKDKFIALDEDTGLYYLLSNDDKPYQNISQNVFPIDSKSCSLCTLEYFPEEKYFIASISGEYSEEKKNIIYKTLEKYDIDKNRVNIKFSFFLHPKGGN